jgi:hypothetical protein
MMSEIGAMPSPSFNTYGVGAENGCLFTPFTDGRAFFIVMEA